MHCKSNEVAVSLDCGRGSNERLEGDELGIKGSGEKCDQESESKNEWDALCLSIHESASLKSGTGSHRFRKAGSLKSWDSGHELGTRAQFRFGLSPVAAFVSL